MAEQMASESNIPGSKAVTQLHEVHDIEERVVPVEAAQQLPVAIPGGIGNARRPLALLAWLNPPRVGCCYVHLDAAFVNEVAQYRVRGLRGAVPGGAGWEK